MTSRRNPRRLARLADVRPWRLALLAAAPLLLGGVASASALGPPTSPTATPAADLSVTDPGLILAVVVIPVILVALIWLGYIFWLIFHEGENIGSGSR